MAYTPPTRPWKPPDCCFPCKVDNHWEQIQAVLNNMPPELWTRFLAEMYTPFLRRLALSDPKGRMPLSWITTLPARRPYSRSLRGLFFNACALAVRNPKLEGSAARPVLQEMHASAWLVMKFMDTNGLLSRNVHGNLWSQMMMLTGTCELLDHFNRCIRNFPLACNAANFAQFTVRCGAENYMLGIIDQALGDGMARPKIERRARRYDAAREKMRAMRVEIVKLVQVIHARRLAVAMVLHPRLGRGSWIYGMPEEVLRTCVGGLAPELVRWDVVARPWLLAYDA
jgi:hypothetical protein